MKVAVVGAGIAGLAAARVLTDAGCTVTVFEKSRGVGGRMSTRREADRRFNHGAQYFTVSDERFGRAVANWSRAGVVRPWRGRIVQLRDGVAADLPNDRSRFVGNPGMSAVCGYLARDIDVRTQTRIGNLDELEGFDARVVAIPAEQARELTPLPDAETAPCIAVFGVFAQRPDLEFAAARVDHSPLAWLAVRDDAFVLHSSKAWATNHFDAPSAPALLEEFQNVIRPWELPKINFVQLHKWRYARVIRALNEPYVWNERTRIGACGDWCLGPRVESAYLSGDALARRVLADAAGKGD